jgi:hypothetical protein
MRRVRPVTPDLFDRVYPLLATFPGSTMTCEQWRRMLFDLPWPVEEKHRGFALLDGEVVVGFMGTIFSARDIGGRRRRLCHLSSWIVRETHRSSSMELLLSVLGMKGYTIVNLTPSDVALGILRRLGFQPLEEKQWLIPRIAMRPPDPSVVVTEPVAIRRVLQGEAARIHADMEGTHAAQALIRMGRLQCHVIATSSRWKWGRRLAHVQYASDWSVLLDHLDLASAAFTRLLGTWGLRIDARFAAERRFRLARLRPLSLPTLYRPEDAEVTPTMIDGLYSEIVNQPPA